MIYMQKIQLSINILDSLERGIAALEETTGQGG
jgi:hypothetical protein